MPHPSAQPQSASITPEQIAQRTGGSHARDIADAVSSLVRAGVAQPGDRLPTVRSLAQELAVGTGVISEAWRILANHGMIATARRNGTIIKANRAAQAGRYWQVPATPGTLQLDLSTGTPDTALLPPLGPVLHQLQADVTITSYIDSPVLDRLEAILTERWPFVPEEFTIVDGAMDALDRIVNARVQLGDTVLVEDPTFPPLLDILELAGANIIGVPLDADGPQLAAFTSGLGHNPRFCFIQPRAHNPTGTSLTAARAKELADAIRLANTRMLIVEDDHTGPVADTNNVSLGAYFPDQTVRIQSFSKSHGPDLRVAALAGAADPIQAVIDRRRLGPSWTSRLVQHLLLAMLEDPEVDALIQHAGAVYLDRRAALCRDLALSGIGVSLGCGLNLWVPVHDEQRATVALAAQGVGVAPGRPFCVEPQRHGPHIRVSIGEARGDLTDLAERIAQSAAV